MSVTHIESEAEHEPEHIEHEISHELGAVENEVSHHAETLDEHTERHEETEKDLAWTQKQLELLAETVANLPQTITSHLDSYWERLTTLEKIEAARAEETARQVTESTEPPKESETHAEHKTESKTHSVLHHLL